MKIIEYIKNLFNNGKKNPEFIGMDLVKIYKSKEPFEIALYYKNKPLSNKNIIIEINGVKYNKTTNKNGIAKLNINLNVGNYKAFVVFNGDEEYNAINGYYDIYVNPKIIVTNDLNMTYKDGSKFECKILDYYDEPINNGTITFNVNGVNYTRGTDSEGIARLNINLNPGEYLIKCGINNIKAINRINIKEELKIIKNHFGYWIFGKDMYNVNIQELKDNNVTDIFLNYYAFKLYGKEKVIEWIKNISPINVHIWMQCFYDGEWYNPKTTNLTDKINEAKYYSECEGVKGIHLDYLRYPGNAYKTEGASEAILNFVKQVKNNINKDIILSCAVMPENETIKYYGQDIEGLNKICDMIIPMQYKGNYNASSSWLEKTTKELSKKGSIWSGLQSYISDDNPTLLSINELENDINIVLNNGAKGVLIFRYGMSPKIKFKE